MALSEIKEYLRCDPERGTLHWIKRPATCVHVGDLAGGLNTQGYIMFRLKGVLYRAHRVIWEFVNGELEDSVEIDHINNDRSDNRIENLRIANRCENCQNMAKPSNNTSGIKGVSWSKYHSKWECYCAVDGVKHKLGRYDSLAEAEQVVVDFRSEHHREFANHG